MEGLGLGLGLGLGTINWRGGKGVFSKSHLKRRRVSGGLGDSQRSMGTPKKGV